MQKEAESSAAVLRWLQNTEPKSQPFRTSPQTVPTFNTSSSSTFLKVLTLITATPSLSHEAGSLYALDGTPCDTEKERSAWMTAVEREGKDRNKEKLL